LARLRNTRAFRAVRYRLVRTLAAIVALGIAIHALVKVLVQSDHQAGDWAYLGISCVIAAGVWLILARSPEHPDARRKRTR
jgi:hypothetical protein